MHFSPCIQGRHQFSSEQAATNVMPSSPHSLLHSSPSPSDPIPMSIDDHLRSLPSPPPPLPSTSQSDGHVLWNHNYQPRDSSMLDGSYGGPAGRTSSAACMQLDHMLDRMHSSTTPVAPANNNTGDMKNLGGALHHEQQQQQMLQQMKHEPIDPAYPMPNLNCVGLPGFEMLSSPYASARSNSEGSIVGLPQMRRGSRSSQDGLYRCQFCPKKLSTQEQLQIHMAECKLDRVHECLVCHKRFKARGGLQQHMRIHDQIKPFTCTFCPKRFTQKSHIDQHLRIHTGMKPFVCRYCGRSFRQRSQQIGHEQTHFNGAQSMGRTPITLQMNDGEPSHLNHTPLGSPSQGSPVSPAHAVPSPYAPMTSSGHPTIPTTNAGNDIASLLGLHSGGPASMNIPSTSYTSADLSNA